MHQYVLIESHCKVSVALWVRPFALPKLTTPMAQLTGILQTLWENDGIRQKSDRQ